MRPASTACKNAASASVSRWWFVHALVSASCSGSLATVGLSRRPLLATKALHPAVAHVLEPTRCEPSPCFAPPRLLKRLVHRLRRAGRPERFLRTLDELEVQVERCAPHVRHRMPPLGR